MRIEPQKVKKNIPLGAWIRHKTGAIQESGPQRHSCVSRYDAQLAADEVQDNKLIRPHAFLTLTREPRGRCFIIMRKKNRLKVEWSLSCQYTGSEGVSFRLPQLFLSSNDCRAKREVSTTITNVKSSFDRLKVPMHWVQMLELPQAIPGNPTDPWDRMCLGHLG